MGCEDKIKDEKISIEVNKNKPTKTTNKHDAKNNSNEIILNQENVVEFLTQYGEHNQHYKYRISTNLGAFEIQLSNNTPLHRANFAYLVSKSYFNTTYFHRVVKDFIIQGGNSDNIKTSQARASIGKYLLPAEFISAEKHKYGSLSAAREWEDNPDKLSDPFEFFVVTNPKGATHLDQEHTVFGKVTKGFDTLKTINNQETDNKEFPNNDIKILSVETLD